MPNCRTLCEDLGASIPSIHSNEENTFITTIMTNRDNWLGGRKYGNDWQWVDGTVMDYTNWADGNTNIKYF